MELIKITNDQGIKGKVKIGERKIEYSSSDFDNEMESVNNQLFNIKRESPHGAKFFRIIKHYWVDYGRQGMEVEYFI